MNFSEGGQWLAHDPDDELTMRIKEFLTEFSPQRESGNHCKKNYTS